MKARHWWRNSIVPGAGADAAILEEHAFVQELAEREIPVVPALVLDGITLHSFKGFRFAVFPKHGGRAPELEDPSTLEWMGRFLGRIHAVGALKPFRARPALDIASFGERAARLSAGAYIHSSRSRRGLSQRGESGAGGRAPLFCAGG